MSEIISQVNDKLQESKVAQANKFFYAALIAAKDLDAEEFRMLMHFYHFLDFNKPYYEQTYFHSSYQWEERLGIGEKTARRKIKSLEEKGYWKVISGAQKREANTFQLTSILTDNFLNKKKKLHVIQGGGKNDTVKMTVVIGQNDRSNAGQNDRPSHTVFNHTLKSEREDTRSTFSKSEKKTHEDLANLLTYRLGERFKNERSQNLIRALERSNAQIDAAITFLSKFGQVFAKSDLSSDQSIIACLQTVIDASSADLEELKTKYLAPRQSSVMAESSTKQLMTDEEAEAALRMLGA